MKKIFTTLSLVALMATSASAAITVSNNTDPKNPTPVANNSVIEIKEFEDWSDLWGYPSFEAAVNFLVDGAAPIDALAVTNNECFSFCTAACLPWEKDGSGFKASITEKSAPFMNMNHLEFRFPDNPNGKVPEVADDYMDITFTDATGDVFKVKLAFHGTGGDSVNEIMAGDTEVVAVYDLQGRRVADNFKGVGIVLTSDGKAAKKIFK